ncbi:MAG: phytoene desaturase family protein [Desulfobulbus sp.]|jgi:all-trans-retinol 13,14-reductase
MSTYRLIIIGGGLSGLAAGIRMARFGLRTLILEQHDRPGGLNSYYLRRGRVLETGLHAMTNWVEPSVRHAPLNQLFRQLRLSRSRVALHEQLRSEIRFAGRSLVFANDPAVLEAEIAREFPRTIDRFRRLRAAIAEHDPFALTPWRSARSFLHEHLDCPLLEDMLLLPLMVYGNAEEHDMELSQFVIMFRALFNEGFCRPGLNMRELLGLLTDHYQELGGELRFAAPVARCLEEEGRIVGVRLENGEEIGAEAVLSTAGMPETIRLTGWQAEPERYTGAMSFMETISLVPREAAETLAPGRTILFYHTGPRFDYARPPGLLDTSWGVICFAHRFAGLPVAAEEAVRVTNAASYPRWRELAPEDYAPTKQRLTEASVAASEEIIGNYRSSIVYQDSFTPLTIERFTRKAQGAVYGSGVKVKDGRTPWPNLFLAGTDQGYLGIVGAMLSGITIVNQHILR